MASILKLDTLQTPSGTGVITSPNKIAYPGGVLQVVPINDGTPLVSTSTNTWYTLPSTSKQITSIGNNSLFIYCAAIPAEYDLNTGGNYWLVLTRNGSIVPKSMTNGTMGRDDSASCTLSTFTHVDQPYVNSGVTLTYAVQGRQSVGSNYIEWNQNTLGSQPPESSFNYTSGYIMEIAQ